MISRYKPVGWRNESYRHYLAAKGVKTKYYQVKSLEDYKREMALREFRRAGQLEQYPESPEGFVPSKESVFIKRQSKSPYTSPLMLAEVESEGGDVFTLSEVTDAFKEAINLGKSSEDFAFFSPVLRKKYFSRKKDFLGRYKEEMSNFAGIVANPDNEFQIAANEFVDIVNFPRVPSNFDAAANILDFKKPVKRRKLVRKSDYIKGGLADNVPYSKFNPVQLAAGIKVEMEHTDNPNIAREIASDHLTEDPSYYVKLAKMEVGKCNEVKK